jgi:DNA-binding MarR family transcriptional regulator
MPKALQHDDYEALAAFRYAMRKFLRFSKDELLKHRRLTPEQYEALLALRAADATPGLTIGQLSERLQVKHHTAVSLVAKLVARGDISRAKGKLDRRNVHLTLTPQGNRLIDEAAIIHREELRKRAGEMVTALQRIQK